MRCDESKIGDLHEDLIDVNVNYDSMEKGEKQPDNISYEILKTYQLTRSVSYFAISDTIFTSFFVFINPWYIFMALCSGAGYFISKTYNYRWYMVYLIYQITIFLVQFSLMLYYVLNTDNPRDLIVFDTIFSVIFLLFDIYIIGFTFKTTKVLRSLIDGDLYQLKNIKNIKVKFIYW